VQTPRESDRMVEQPYDSIAERWDAARTRLSAFERRSLDLVLENLPPGSTVLDLGCGTGRPIAEAVVEHGHRVIGVDQSAQLLALACQRYPESEWLHARLETFPFDRAVRAAICWDSLFHIERRHHEGILAGIARSLPEGGRLMLTTGGSAHPPFTDTMFDHTFFYDSHPPEEACALVERVGFRLLRAEFINPPTDGRDRGRLGIVAERTSLSVRS